MCIFGSQPNIITFIIIWIKSSMKHKSSSIVPEWLIRNFTCKLRISCQINLISPIFIKILTFFSSKYPYNHFGNMLFLDDTPCKIMFNGLYSAIFLEFLTTFMGTTIICWGLFFTWNLFILLDLVFPTQSF
jgi:hypothetical protein